MKRILAGLVLLLAAGLGAPYAATAARPPDTARSYGWGSSYFGQLGVGLTGIAMSPVAVEPAGEFEQIVTGERHTCALDADGQAWCWGLGVSGQLGDGQGTSSPVPVAVNLPKETVVSQIAVGTWGSCALDSDGHAYCWGISYSLGDGSTTNAESPVKVDTDGVLAGKTLTDITMGGFAACALDTEGLAYCWGVNSSGQLGTGDTVNAPRPRAVDTSGVLSGAVLTDIDVGGGHTCAVDQKQHAFCWGDNYHGQLGDGTTTNALSAVQVDQSVAEDLIGITAGGSHTCALTTGHDAYCWGFGGYGQLGMNSTTNASTPGAVVGLPTGGLDEISAGGTHTCGIAGDGSTLCWGDGTEGRVGNNSIAKTLVPDIVPVPDPPVHLAAGYNHSCMVDPEGNAYCWGAGESGQLGDGRVWEAWSPVAMPGAATQVAAGTEHACAILQDGSVTCAGNGDQGQLGMGSVGYRDEPVTVPLGPATAITAGEAHTCALVDGRAYCWGNGSYGQLGDPAKRSSLVPIPVSVTGVLAGKTLVSITAGGYHTCAIDTGGKAYCWGRNQEGQLGNGGGGSAFEPVAVTDPGKPLAGISAGSEHTCAVATDGSGFCWGNNQAGQLGTGDAVDSSVPVGVTGGHHFTAISAGRRATCGIADGVALCWGSNAWAQLGTGDMIPRLAPTAVTGLAGLTMHLVSAGVSHACAATDQYFYCWGMNEHGEIGAVTGQYATSAVLVSGTTATPAALSCGQGFTLAATTEPPPISAPDPPTGLGGTAGDAQVQLQWTAPAWDGGSPITSYSVTGSPAGTCTSTATACTIEGLSNGIAHTFTVTATNAYGNSAASGPVVLTPVASPSPTAAPVGKLKARVKVHRKKAVVRWTRASNATKYQVRVRRPGKKFTSWKSVSKRKYVVRHLKPGKRYVIRVRGVNTDDEGPIRTLRFRAKRR
ncbi:MAG: fibronectin type III domain-containing protein [Candidatus Nanopelagicales bacterium]